MSTSVNILFRKLLYTLTAILLDTTLAHAQQPTDYQKEWEETIELPDSIVCSSIAEGSGGEQYLSAYTKNTNNNTALLLAYSANGNLLWQTTTASATASLSEWPVKLTASGNVVYSLVKLYSATTEGYAVAAYSNTGGLLWQQEYMPAQGEKAYKAIGIEVSGTSLYVLSNTINNQNKSVVSLKKLAAADGSTAATLSLGNTANNSTATSLSIVTDGIAVVYTNYAANSSTLNVVKTDNALAMVWSYAVPNLAEATQQYRALTNENGKLTLLLQADKNTTGVNNHAELYSLGISDGSLQWSNTALMTNAEARYMATNNNTLYVLTEKAGNTAADKEIHLMAYNTNTGSETATRKVSYIAYSLAVGLQLLDGRPLAVVMEAAAANKPYTIIRSQLYDENLEFVWNNEEYGTVSVRTTGQSTRGVVMSGGTAGKLMAAMQFSTNLTGSQELRLVKYEATGAAKFTISSATNENISYTVTGEQLNQTANLSQRNSFMIIPGLERPDMPVSVVFNDAGAGVTVYFMIDRKNRITEVKQIINDTTWVGNDTIDLPAEHYTLLNPNHLQLNLLSRIPTTRGACVPAFTTALTYVYEETYADAVRTLFSQRTTYYDDFGNTQQVLVRDIEKNIVLVTENLFDHFARPVGSTLAAPVQRSTVCDFTYSGTFLAGYGPDNYEDSKLYNPDPLPENSDLKKYFSIVNTAEPLVAETNFPYSRVNYFNDISGRVKQSAGVGENYYMKSKHLSNNFVTNNAGELDYVFGYQKLNVIRKEQKADMSTREYLGWAGERVEAQKKITKDAEGLTSITYTGTDGRLIAKCVSGVDDRPASCKPLLVTNIIKMSYDADGAVRGYVDIHLPAAHNDKLKLTTIWDRCMPLGFTAETIGEYKIYDMEQSLTVPLTEGTDYTINSNTRAVTFLNDVSEYLRISYKYNGTFRYTFVGENCAYPPDLDYLNKYVLEATVSYELDYSRWSLYYYDDLGNLAKIISPKGMDCDYLPIPGTYEEKTSSSSISFTAPNGNEQLQGLVRLRIAGNDRCHLCPGGDQSFLRTQFPDTTYVADSIPLTAAELEQKVLETPWTDPDTVKVAERQVFPEPGVDVFKLELFRKVRVVAYAANGDSKILAENLTLKGNLELTLNELDYSKIVSHSYGGGFNLENVINFNSYDIGFVPEHINMETMPGEPHLQFIIKGFKSSFVVLNNSNYGTYSPDWYPMILRKLSLADIANNNLISELCPNNSTSFDFKCDNGQPSLFITTLRNFLYGGYAPYSMIKAEYYWLPKLEPAHTMAETYNYNTLGQLISKNSPDEGTNRYAYDAEGKLRFTANAEQLLRSKVNYLLYDRAARVTETGEAELSTANLEGVFGMAAATSQSASLLEGAASGALLNRSYRKYVVYDRLGTSQLMPGSNTFTQNYRYRYGAGNALLTSNDNTISWYGYDRYGRIVYHVQNMEPTAAATGFVASLGTGAAERRLKTVDYTYNITGLLTEVEYGRNGVNSEKLQHRYVYDKNGRLVNASFKKGTGNTEPLAAYSYYQHGALKRAVLGDKIQGLDYIYLADGRLKAMNNPDLSSTTLDPGLDGTTTGADFADRFAYALDYYENDYIRTGVELRGMPDAVHPDRHDGTIKAIRWNTKGKENITDASTDFQFVSQGAGEQMTYYHTYDKLGQLSGSTLGKIQVSNTNWQSQFTPHYALSGIDYDHNGNLIQMNRAAYVTSIATAYADMLNYKYTPNSNRLSEITDQITNRNHGILELYTAGASAAFAYDAAGRSTTDPTADIADIRYTNTGKVSHINFGSTGKTIDYVYNERDQLHSVVTLLNGQASAEWYVRDLSGNILATYTNDNLNASNSADAQLNEQVLYAAGRVGVYATGSLLLELTDHTGNVRATVQGNGATKGSIATWADYYPHGSVLPGRNSNNNTYLFGYQGQEQDAQTGYTRFDLRQFNALLGRWSTPDPMGQYHSAYLAMGNNPISLIDPTGGQTDAPNMETNSGGFGEHQDYTEEANSLWDEIAKWSFLPEFVSDYFAENQMYGFGYDDYGNKVQSYLNFTEGRHEDGYGNVISSSGPRDIYITTVTVNGGIELNRMNYNPAASDVSETWEGDNDGTNQKPMSLDWQPTEWMNNMKGSSSKTTAWEGQEGAKVYSNVMNYGGMGLMVVGAASAGTGVGLMLIPLGKGMMAVSDVMDSSYEYETDREKFNHNIKVRGTLTVIGIVIGDFGLSRIPNKVTRTQTNTILDLHMEVTEGKLTK